MAASKTMEPLRKTLMIAFASGLGHVLSSVLLGFVGLTLGLAVSRLEATESWRGNAAAWLFIAFGFAYFIWGLHRAVKNRPHRHIHAHADGELHEHIHEHESEHVQRGNRLHQLYENDLIWQSFFFPIAVR